ncbi:hypothetical protein [Clostridium tertium]
MKKIDPLKIYEFINKISDIFNSYNEKDFSILFYFICIVIFLVIFKFIYSNGLLSSEKQSSFNKEALNAHIEVKSSIYLYRHKKIAKTDLLVSLNSLISFNDNSYLNLVNQLNDLCENDFVLNLNKIERLINDNISSLKYHQSYIISINDSPLNKVELFFKTYNIKLLGNSFLISIIILYIILILSNTIIKYISMRNITDKTFLIGLSFLLFCFLLFSLSRIASSIHNNDYLYKYVIVFNVFLFITLFFLIKIKEIQESQFTQRVIVAILLILSIAFSIFTEKGIRICKKPFTFIKKLLIDIKRCS